MARIRTIKPEFWTSEQIVECSVRARLLFIGVWNFSDDAGRHPASVMRLKMEVFPADTLTEKKMRALVDELIAAGLLIEYTAQDENYWQVTGWHNQKIERPTIRHPAPEFGDTSPTSRRDITITSPPEGKGREGKKERTLKPEYSEPFLLWWAAYPRKVGKRKAAPEWKRAIGRIPEKNGQAPESWLLEITRKFAASPKGQSGKFCPHPTTWLYQGCYDDDPATWQDGSGEQPHKCQVPTDEDLIGTPYENKGPPK